jgi:hypothetical protein
MEPIDIIILLIAISVVGFVIINYIYRRVHNKPTGDCKMCTMNSEKTINKIRKELKKAKKQKYKNQLK